MKFSVNVEGIEIPNGLEVVRIAKSGIEITSDPFDKDYMIAATKAIPDYLRGIVKVITEEVLPSVKDYGEAIADSENAYRSRKEVYRNASSYNDLKPNNFEFAKPQTN